MNYFVLLLAGLTTWVVSLFISKTDGPLWIFRRIRQAAAPRSNLRKGLECQWCVATWVGAAVVAYLVWIAHDVQVRGIPLWWFSIVGVAIACNQVFTKGD